MDGKSLVTRIALLIVGFSLVNVLLWGVLIGSRGIVGNIVGLVINVILAVYLISGQNWARWVMAIRCGFGAIFAFSAWSQLGEAGFSIFSLIRGWLLAVALFSAAIGAYLLLSKRVNDHFNPSTGF
jgi:hypothetical protein